MIPFDTTQITSPYDYSHPRAGDPCHPLAAGAHPLAIAQSNRGHAGGPSEALRSDCHGALPMVGYYEISEEGTAYTLNATEVHAVQSTALGVRRLTPRECERLQGFPDDWTAQGVDGSQADSARYRQLGNAVCVPVSAWLGRRIMEHAR